MKTRGEDLVAWRQLSPIFADVVLSPWNLLVGGLLIRFLSPLDALISIVLGYAILGVIFVLYGGLGFKKRMQSAEILTEVFRGRFSSIFIPLLLALGQLGWAAINISLGGSSLAEIFHFPPSLGMILYAVVIISIASLGLYRMAIVKMAVIVSAMSLAAYVGILKVQQGGISHFMAYQPAHGKSLFWGCSVVVASLISFATVSPDFFKSLRHKHDIVRATAAGIFLPGILMCLLGCFFFFDAPLDLVGLIGGLSFALLPNTFNAIANTDGSMALYTPALKFQLLFKWKLMAGLLLGGAFSLTIALLGITSYLEAWLKILSVISPIFIGVAFAAVVFDKAGRRSVPKHFSRQVYATTAILCVLVIDHTVPVLLALLTPLIIYSLYLQYRHIHE